MSALQIRPRACAEQSAYDPSVGPAVRELFGSLSRRDQQRWADAYVRGLLSAAGRKSLQNLARATSASPGAVQSLHQFVNSSPWDWQPVRQTLSRWIGRRAPVRARVVSAALVPKRGDHSVGVRLRYDAERSRGINCQFGVGLFLATGAHCLPVEWGLVLDGTWGRDEDRRRRARLPESAVVGGAWRHALMMAPGSGAGPLVVDGRCADDLRSLSAALAGRGVPFVIEVGGRERFVAPDVVPGRQPTAQELLAGRPRGAIAPGAAFARACPVHLPRVGTSGTAPGTLRLWRLSFPADPPRDRFVVTNLPGMPAEDVRGYVGCVDDARKTVATLKEDFGLADFEGRSYPGWHHHMTLVSTAYAIGTLPAWSTVL